jgi:2-polyprenyl-6-methoxyphenol hydroxylase-like FAD-dependent oxidoreductase
LDLLDNNTDLYFDRVSQVRMNQSGDQRSWTRGRVTLLGDAASCVSLLAGQGSALAMVAAYILAGELHAARGDYARAFARYQERFGPFVTQKQQAALRFAGAFAPKSKFGLFFRNHVMNLMRIPWITDLVVSRGITDKLTLDEY